MRRTFVLVLIGFITSVPAIGQHDAKPADEMDKVHSVPFLNGVEVMLNGHGPYRFGLDTGSGSAFILKPELAQELALPVTGHTKMSAGRKYKSDPEVEIVHVDEMTVAGHMVRDSIGMPIKNYSPMVKDGMGTLGMAAFKDVVLHLDHVGDKLWLTDEPLPKPDGSFGHRVGDHKDREDLHVDVLQRVRKRNQVDVHRVEDQFDGHQNDHHVPPRQHAHGADEQQRRAQCQVMDCGNRVHCQILFFAMTTEPTTATSSRTEAISKGSRYSEKSESASTSVFPMPGGSNAWGPSAIWKESFPR